MKASKKDSLETRDYEYFGDHTARSFRYSGEKDRFEERVGDEWVPVKRDKCAAGKDLPSEGLITNIAYTTYQDWNTDPEPSTIAPKSLAEQVAGTQVGRAMQMHAEERLETVDENNAAAFDEIEFERSRHRIQELVDEGSLDTDKSGKPLNRRMNGAVLGRMKTVLESTILRPEEGDSEEVRTAINALLSKIEPALEAVEAPDRIAGILHEFTDLQKQVRTAIGKREFEALSYLNEKMVQTAYALLAELDQLRKSNPDRLVRMISDLRYKEQPLPPYKSALIEFVRTHNTFKFSNEMENRLRFGRASDFYTALLKAYETEKQEDNPDKFIAGVTRIPEKRLTPLLRSTKRYLAQN